MQNCRDQQLTVAKSGVFPYKVMEGGRCLGDNRSALDLECHGEYMTTHLSRFMESCISLFANKNIFELT